MVKQDSLNCYVSVYGPFEGNYFLRSRTSRSEGILDPLKVFKFVLQSSLENLLIEFKSER